MERVNARSGSLCVVLESSFEQSHPLNATDSMCCTCLSRLPSQAFESQIVSARLFFFGRLTRLEGNHFSVCQTPIA
jgi:hypothetical protein